MSRTITENLPKKKPVDEGSRKGTSAAEELFDEEDAEYADVRPSRATRKDEPTKGEAPKSKKKLPRFLVNCVAEIADGGELVTIPFARLVYDPEDVVHTTSAVMTTKTVSIKSIDKSEAKTLLRQLEA